MPPLSSPDWNVLHYDCWSSEEFVRKWTTNATVHGAHFRGPRERIRQAAAAILDNPATDDDQKRQLMVHLYEATTADDVEQLEEAGVLVTPLEEHHRYEPRGLGPDHAAIHRLLDLLVAAGKEPFWARREEHPGTLFQDLRRGGDLSTASSTTALGLVLDRTTTLPSMPRHARAGGP